MTDLYTTVSEIKAILRISGSGEDFLLEQQNYAATDLLNAVLGVNTLKFKTHVDEPIMGRGYDFFNVSNYPIAAVQDNLVFKYEDGDELEGIEFLRAGVRSIFIKQILSRDITYLCTYDAGYILYDTLELIDDSVDLADLDGKTITVRTAYSSTTYTLKATLTDPAVATEIEIGDDLEETAANIAAVITGSSNDGDAIVTFAADHFVTTNILSADATLTQKTVPNYIRNVIAFLVAGLKSEQMASPSVASYTLGSKTVTFRNSIEADFVNRVLADFLPTVGAEIYSI